MIGVIGESLIDLIGMRDGAGRELFDSHVGGCGLNAATAIGRLGGSVMFFGGVSSDMFGKRIVRHLVKNQVMFDPDLCNLPFPSALGFASLDESGSASYAFYSKGSAAMTVTTEQLSMALSVNTDIRIVHIGSISLAMRPVCDAVMDSVAFMNPHPVVFFDPNVRPSVIDDFSAYRARFLQAAKMADIIKLSEEDLAAVYVGLSMDDAVSALRSEVDAHIVLTRGSDGSSWFTSDGDRVDCPVVPSPVTDTVGAGDTFSGALLHYLQTSGMLGADGTPPRLAALSHGDISEMLRFASAAAAVTCSRPGCDPPTLDEVRRLYDGL